MGLTFTVDAQSSCSSKSKEVASCSKKTATTENVATTDEGVAVLVSNLQTETDSTEKFTVYGNCGMCERTIEGSLKDVDGVTLADWDKETDQMTVSFNPKVITLDAIKQKIADVGYDSETHRAKDEIYNSLSGCCQYERFKN